VRADPNMGDLVQWEHPQNWGGINVGLNENFQSLTYFLRCASYVTATSSRVYK